MYLRIQLRRQRYAERILNIDASHQIYFFAMEHVLHVIKEVSQKRLCGTLPWFFRKALVAVPAAFLRWFQDT